MSALYPPLESAELRADGSLQPCPECRKQMRMLDQRRGPTIVTSIPQLRFALLDVCRADVRRVRYRFLRWREFGYSQMPAGFGQGGWYELRSCTPVSEPISAHIPPGTSSR